MMGRISRYFVGDNGTTGCSRISGDDHPSIVKTSNNGRARAGGFGEWHALCVQNVVSVVVAEVEARHDGQLWLDRASWRCVVV